MELLGAINRYLATSGMSASRFGRDVAGDRQLVFDMRRGRCPRAKMQRRILTFIAQGSER